ncbi:hypothetical protein ACJ41O_012472 [Fusarium nematophilum]
MTGHSFHPDEDIPDLSGKVIIVTGGNSGLGLESIRQLAKHNPAHIYLAARSAEKGEAAIAQLKGENPSLSSLSFLQLDLASFESIQSAANKFNASSSRLDLLINNAGIMAAPEGTTKEGYEIQFGTNHMGPALFTQLLLPTLKKTAASPGSDVRVVFLSSKLESSAPENSYQLGSMRTTMPHISTWARYGISKLANIHYNAALADRNHDIKFVSVHPGIVQTNLSGPMMSEYNVVVAKIIGLATKLVSVTPEKGALNQLWAATSPTAKTGTYYAPVGVEAKSSHLGQDRDKQEQLWEWTEQELQRYVSPSSSEP